MMSGILIVTKKLSASPRGGRELLCRLNYDALESVYSESLRLFELSSGRLFGVKSQLDAFRGHIDGLNKESIESALAIVKREGIKKIFVDGSNLGEFVKSVKLIFPHVEVITFFHNVEARFFWGSLKQTKSLRALAVLVANYLAERKAVHGSDKIICLNERDSCLLKNLYGRGATHISSMALEDKMPPDYFEMPAEKSEKFALFVGGTFYANQSGIEWFINNVVPRIDVKICIVGRGFEDLRKKLEIPNKVEVVGAVDSLAEWYHRAHFVLAPIFDGSGMKTKVAEALMYGKKIVGTPEAFTGYENIIDKVGWMCSSVDEFVASINEAKREVSKAFDPALREIYLNSYSLRAARERLVSIINEN